MRSSDIYRLRQLNRYQQDPAQIDIMGDDPTSIEPTFPEQLRIDRGDPLPELEEAGPRRRYGTPVSRSPLESDELTVKDAPPFAGSRGIEDNWDAINKIYTPDTTSRDRLNRLLDSYPEREDPHWARKVTASLMGWSAGRRKGGDPLETMEKVMYAPHLRKLSDWKEQAEPYAKAAQVENTANVNERTLAGNLINAQTQADRLAENARQADQKAEISRYKNQIDLLKARMGPGWYLDARNGTTVMAFNRATGETRNTGIPTRWMNEEDKLNVEGEWDVMAANARGAYAVEGAQIRADATEAGRTARIETPVQATARRQAEIRKVFEEHPEYQRLFRRNPNGTLELIKRPGYTWNVPGDLFGGRSADEQKMRDWDAANKLLNPGYQGPSAESPEGPRTQGGQRTDDINLDEEQPDTTSKASPPAQKTLKAKKYSPSQDTTYYFYDDGSIETKKGRN